MLRTYQLIADDLSQAELAAVQKIYGTTGILQSDGKTRWYSRLPDEDRRRGTDYEMEHAWFIPGDPFEALAGLIIFRVSST
jgi:hypothetical protein